MEALGTLLEHDSIVVFLFGASMESPESRGGGRGIQTWEPIGGTPLYCCGEDQVLN